MTYSSVDSFYVSDDTISSSPSRKDGVEESTELMLRRFGCDLIQQGGILLRLPQAVMATGQVLLQRFYCKQSLAKFDVRKMAPASLWLAAKIEESSRRVRDLVNVFHRMRCRRDNLDVSGLSTARYEELKKDLLDMELHMLRELGFVCHVEHPHKFVLSYLLSLDPTHEFLQEAWSLTNDSLRTTLCVQFKSEVVACGVVYAAARRCKVALPSSPPWWKVFGAEEHQLVAVCEILAHLYRQPKSEYVEVDSGEAIPDSGARSRKHREMEKVVKPVRGPAKKSVVEFSEQRSDGRLGLSGDAVALSTPDAVNSASAVHDCGPEISRCMEREKSGRGEEKQGRRDYREQSSSNSTDLDRWERKESAKDMQVRDCRKRSRVHEGRERMGTREQDEKYDESRLRGRTRVWEKESQFQVESKKIRTEAFEFPVESCRVSHLRTTRELSHRTHRGMTGGFHRRDH